MKQKYVIQKKNGTNQLAISEFSELDKGAYSLVYEETYDTEAVKAAVKDGAESLAEMLRTPNLYPTGLYIEKMVESVINMYNSESEESVEIFFNDKELLAKEHIAEEIIEVVKVAPEIDELLDDDTAVPDEKSENHIADDEIKIISSIKVAEDDTLDTNEEE